MTAWKWRHLKYGEFVFMEPSPIPRTTLQHFIPSRSNRDVLFFFSQKTNHFMLVGFSFLVFEVTKVHSQTPPTLLNASHCQFIPPPSFSSLLYPPPITHPFSSSLLARPIPQTNQFACLSSILFPMPAPTLSFVLYCNLQFQRPSINLNFPLPSFTPPNPLHTHPSPFLIYFSRRTLIQPLLLIRMQFHSESPCSSVSNCKQVL